MSLRFVAAVLLVSASIAAARQVGMRGAAAHVQPAPAPAPAPGPAGPSINVLTVEWEIENMNYMDMTKPQKDVNYHANNAAMDKVKQLADNEAKHLADNAAKNGTQLLQVEAAVVTVADTMRTAIEGTIKGMLGAACGAPAPSMAPVAPAPAMRPVVVPLPPSGVLPQRVALVAASGLRSSLPYAAAPTPGAAPAPSAAAPAGPICSQPQVHVAFQPGHKIKKKHLINLLNAPAAPPAARSVMVKVTIFDRPGNGRDDLQGVQGQLQQALASGELKANLKAAIHAATGIEPKMSSMKVQTKIVQQWDFQKCGSHMTNLVQKFAVQYTRRQVPWALYNECTTFRTKMSFSHDYIMDARDKVRCRIATRKFALSWKLDKKKENAKEFEPLCQRFCEAKFGNDAPQCVY